MPKNTGQYNLPVFHPNVSYTETERLTLSTGDGRVIHTHELLGDNMYETYEHQAAVLKIMTAPVPSNYRFELRRKDGDKGSKKYYVYLVPQTEGFEFFDEIPAPNEELINAACGRLVRKLQRAKLDAALDRGPVVLGRK